MAKLSVIVPVHGVEDYLAQCLDSLLGRGPNERGGDCLEVIAVDDASPDGSAEILARHAERDPRLRVITLGRNGGLGAARNTGLDHARGEYVWFVDADDWLPDGTLEAVLARLAQTAPDVLVVDYARLYPDGRQERYGASDLHPGGELPDVFTLTERPAMLCCLHIACNKVVRREFLLGTGIRFVAGWYEDVSFSIPLMLSARRLSDLSRVSYCYRQRLNGSITSTVDDRHFDVFGQWERVFAYMDGHPDLAGLRPQVFARMMWHLLAVLSQPDRVPAHRRRAFFAEMTRLYRSHRPPEGYPLASRSGALSHRLVGLGAYRLHRGLHNGAHAARAILRRIRPAARPTVH